MRWITNAPEVVHRKQKNCEAAGAIIMSKVRQMNGTLPTRVVVARCGLVPGC